MKYKLKEIRPQVFFVSCENNYDLAMLFLRYQEFYESPNPKFRGKSFTIIDFMEWYSKNISKHKSFTYAEDWAGYNFSRTTLDDFYAEYIQIQPDVWVQNEWQVRVDDYNKYDETMETIYNRILNKVEHEQNFYLIGANTERLIKHELSHAFFYLRPEYKKAASALVKHLNPELRKQFDLALKNIGYTKSVLIDEIVAYMSTGVPKSFKLKIKAKDRKPFIKLFEEHYAS